MKEDIELKEEALENSLLDWVQKLKKDLEESKETHILKNDIEAIEDLTKKLKDLRDEYKEAIRREIDGKDSYIESLLREKSRLNPLDNYFESLEEIYGAKNDQERN